ncbi:probable methyltransferase At1g27930 [Ipomoea triloba]|uniref:probable methyltransferase At1g27930 n=1 Tax=Ipomoea triloba TaxID=35885 RepID=UPI00125E0B96|nr:probable methyltransferase At1g27930 [Ipomoea triloba]XP_031124364.1 probable methyltransferase At1g27930 [Ipomoea triloba]
MPPEQVFTYYQSKTTPLLVSSSFISDLPKSHSFKHAVSDPLFSKCYSSMKITRKNVIPVLVFVLSVASLIRLLKISVITASFSSFYYYPWSPGGTAALPPTRLALVSGDDHHLNILSKKEMRFLSDLISERAPCNILVFGLESQYSGLISMLNVGGFTLFLEDNDDKMKTETMMMSMNKSRVHKVEYQTRAEDAYQLLKDARKHPHLCSPLASYSITSNRSSNGRSGRCKLANALLARLSQEVYETDWDVVVVDGPSGHQAESPGRMATIYAAAVLARKIRTTSDDEKMQAVDVVVHDVDRMIEKWFSWEFLCANNLVASKGRFWNFRIQPYKSNNATKFC